ncbi:MAG: hypothetical protein AAGA91_16520, partial [Pseudomonadota bacterium]
MPETQPRRFRRPHAAVKREISAGIAQLVERNLAKVEAGRAASTVPAPTAVVKREISAGIA